MAISSATLARSPAKPVAALCGAQVLVQIGAFFWPALLPGMIPLWKPSNSEAGWITASFYGAYMVSVPVLVTVYGIVIWLDSSSLTAGQQGRRSLRGAAQRSPFTRCSATLEASSDRC